MYEFVLGIHSWLRWFLLLALFAVLASAAAPGLMERMGKSSKRLRLITVSLADTQLLLGLVLYLFLSPITETAFQDFGAAMKEPVLRFWAVEHLALMLLSLVAMHIGHARAKRKPESARKAVLLGFGFGLLAMLLAIPWPGMAAARPLFRL